MSRLLLIVVAAFLFFASPACAQSKTFVSSEGRFSIDLGVKPTEVRNSAEASVGGKKLWWKTGTSTFSVSYVDNPNATAERANKAVHSSADAYIAAIPRSAEVVSRNEIQLDGYPGVEVRSREPDGYTVVTRYYMAGTRLYCVMALWMAGANDTVVLKTLDSFKVLKDEPPS